MTINNNSVVVNNPLENDNLSGFNSSDQPTVSTIKVEKNCSLVSAVGATSVDKDTYIFITFSEAMLTSSITATTTGTTSNCSGTVQLSTESSFPFTNCIAMSSSPGVPNNTNKEFKFIPSSNLSISAGVYKIVVTTGVKDASGISMQADNETVLDNGFTVSKTSTCR